MKSLFLAMAALSLTGCVTARLPLPPPPQVYFVPDSMLPQPEMRWEEYCATDEGKDLNNPYCRHEI